tara:strand:- start:242 stop:1033 length:792 start_codon:yes stop_codon:yes gene_type:complete
MSFLGLLGAAAGNFFLPGVGGAIGGALGSAFDQSNAASSAAGATGAAANQATQLQQQMFQQNQQNQTPYLQAGQTGLNALIPLATNYQKFGMDQFQQDPGYAFRLSEGQKALDRQAAARGGLISGGALKAAQAYGQNMGSQEYTNAFNRYQAERQAQLGPLQSLAGIGQNAANNLGNAGQQYGQYVGNALMNQGANVGNAGMVGSNAMTSGLTGALSAYGKSPVSFNSLYGGNQMYNPTTNTGGFSGSSLANTFYSGTGGIGD